MEAMAGLTAVVILIGIFGGLFWFGKELKRIFRPMGRMLDAADTHATVFSAEVKNSAITKASKLTVNADTIKTGRMNLALIDAFDLDITKAELDEAMKAEDK